jgi:hypothetical protein
LTGLADGTATNTRAASLSADEPVAIPLSTAEKSVFAPEICLVTIKNACEINSLNVIRATRATAEIGRAETRLATDRQRNSAAHFASLNSASLISGFIDIIALSRYRNGKLGLQNR